MERGKNKRGRDHQGEEAKSSAKKQYLDIDHVVREQIQEGAAVAYESSSSSDNDLELGVFDFPWLKKSMISKPSSSSSSSLQEEEEWFLEDSFSWSLMHDTAAASSDELLGQCCFSEITCMESIDHIPLEKFEESLWTSLEMEKEEKGSGDCSWASMLNHPPSQKDDHACVAN